jgi:hypothetical protein
VRIVFAAAGTAGQRCTDAAAADRPREHPRRRRLAADTILASSASAIRAKAACSSARSIDAAAGEAMTGVSSPAHYGATIHGGERVTEASPPGHLRRPAIVEHRAPRPRSSARKRSRRSST